MRVIRISLQGTVTSFRYPHIHLGRQPSFPMPPPATVYGHICSAIGDWIPPDSARFAYSFQCDGTGDDLELLHMAQVSSGRLDKAWGYVKNLEVQTNVYPRETLLHPCLILYVDAASKTEEWVDNFRSPRYPVLLAAPRIWLRMNPSSWLNWSNPISDTSKAHCSRGRCAIVSLRELPFKCPNS